MRIDVRITLLATTILLMAGCTHVRDPLQDWLKAGYSARYRAPTTAENAMLAEVFARGLRGELPGDLRLLGYEAEHPGSEHALREAAPRARGWGAYVVRAGPARPLVVQAPHAESDRFTGEIAFAIYRTTQARMLALNSAHRSHPDGDQANAVDAPFAVLGREAVRACPDALVVQVHGYGAPTAARHGLDAHGLVLSNGTRAPDPDLRTVAACLVDAGFAARLYPEQAPHPGGTRNAVRAAMAAAGGGRFIHLEIGEVLRAELARDPVRTGALAACL